jgi:deoxyribonuclease-4
MFLGCHLSIAKGYLAAGKEAESLGANVFQFFTRNPRGSQAKKLDPKDAKALISFAKEKGFGPLVAHAPYILNPASNDERIRNLARGVLLDDFKRLAFFPGAMYNLHPGCHMGRGSEAAMEATMDLLNETYPRESEITVLLETMAGKGTEIGWSFKELAYMLERFKAPEKIGVCFDSCHVSDAGYDLFGDLDGVLAEFDQEVGVERILAIHLNDSQNLKGSRKDRHAKIGEGNLGLNALVKFIGHPLLKGRPIILETPNDPAGYAHEIRLLKDALGLKALK